MGLGAATAFLAAGALALVAVRRHELRVGSTEGRRAVRLVAGGVAFTALCIGLNAMLDVSIGRLHVLAALALVGLLAVVAGGAYAVIAILRRRERSTLVYATVPLSLLALLWVVVEAAFDVA